MSIILEWADLGYTKRVLEAACKLNWESLQQNHLITPSIDSEHRFVNKSTINVGYY
jgi:hypothetical protein